jgi:hypothetical protein
MKKDVYYFDHDVNAHQDVKCKAMMSVYGAEGYGWWWILCELMRQEQGCQLSISRKFDIPSLASSLPNCDNEKCKEFIDDCINEFELLVTDGDFVWSKRLKENYDRLEERREKRRSAANKRWGKKEEQVFSKEEIEAPKEIKPKETDPAKIKSIQVLNDDKTFNIFVEQLKEHDDFKNLHDKHFQNERSKCLDWLSANGKAKKDYKAFFRSWLRNNFNAPTEQASVIPRKKGQKPMVL